MPAFIVLVGSIVSALEVGLELKFGTKRNSVYFNFEYLVKS